MNAAKRLPAVAALALAVVLGCWWTLHSASIDAPKPAESAAPGTARLVVRVSADETGDPIAGADVYVADRRDKERAAKTDADGVARFKTLPAGQVWVLVEATGFARGMDGFVNVWEDAEAESLVALQRGVAATGVVLDENGRQLAGASAMTTDGPDDWLDDSNTPYAETITAADGTFRLEGVPAVRQSFLQFTAPKYAVTTIAWDPAAGRRVEARLVRAGRLEGRVREPSGRPAAEAHVRVSSPDRPKMWETTDAEGRFTIEKLPVGVAWSLRAEKDGFIDAAPVEVVVRDGASPASCDLRLRRRPRLEFLVLDGAGAPVDAAEIDVKDASGRFEPKQCVKGRATFEVVEAGACQVTVDAPRFVLHEETAEAAVDETRQVVVRLDAGASLTGVVVDDAGAPVAGAAVEVSGGTIPGFGDWTRSATSSADGAFRVEGLVAGPHRMNVAAELHATWDEDATAPSDALRIVLPRFSRVTIRLRAPTDERPPGEVSVQAWPIHDPLVGPTGQAQVSISAAQAAPWSGSSWKGELLLAEGKWSVGVFVAGCLPESRQIDVAYGCDVTLDEIVLDRGNRVAGVVVDDLGRPVSGARVALRHGPFADVFRMSSFEEIAADGSFAFECISRTDHFAAVVAMIRGGDSAEVAAPRLPCDLMRIVLRRNGVVAFRVRGPGDAPPASTQISVDGARRGDVPASGDCRLSIAPGTARIQALAPGFAPTTVEVEVVPGADVRLPDMVLGEGATLVGRVVDAEGRAVVKADVQAYADSVGHDLATDESGAFRVEHLPASTVHVWVRAPGFLDAELEFAAVTEATPVVVTMRHGGVLRGLVHYPDGAPARDLKIQIAELRQDSTLRPSLTSAFEERLHAGRYTVVVKRGDTTLATREAEVREGEETPVDISVSR